MYLKGYEGVTVNRDKSNFFILLICCMTTKVGIGRMPLPFFPNDERDIEILFVNIDIVLKLAEQERITTDLRFVFPFC